MGEKRFAKEPLLYIHQPTIKTPEAPMQHNYMTPTKEKQSSTDEPQPNRKTRSRSNRRRQFDQLEEIEDEVSDEIENKKTNTNQAKKRFTDMNINEKINYFLNRSIHSPELRCEMKTDDRNYRGVITDFQNNIVFIRVGRRASSTEVPIDQVKNIRLLGF